MGFKKEYFPAKPGDPQPLVARCKRTVRFEEVDSVNMVWHGRFPSYLEDGRIAFGEQYGLSYKFFREKMVVAPIVQMHIDYKAPLRLDQTAIIETSLHWSEAARVNFSYRIITDDLVNATAYTVQLLTEPNGTILLAPPVWLEKFLTSWKNGELNG